MDYKLTKFCSLRDDILSYLKAQKKLEENDIKERHNLPREEKEEIGLVILNAYIAASYDRQYMLRMAVNNTKLRPGDLVRLFDENVGSKVDATVIENGFDNICIECSGSLDSNHTYRIEVMENVFLDTLISIYDSMSEGMSGTAYLKFLTGEKEPRKIGYGAIDIKDVILPSTLNEQQKEACLAAFNMPSLYCIQGPPGTGKTDVLSTIAANYANVGKDVLVLSRTHQAVNNALNSIARKNGSSIVVKIGAKLKSIGLHESVQNYATYNEYLKCRKKDKALRCGSVLGMSLQGSFVNFGLRTTEVSPQIILVDEAGQVPLIEGLALSRYGCNSIVFIGDDLQMPPIFNEHLTEHPLSKSIFAAMSNSFHGLSSQLVVTYRMNEEITEVVSSNYYEPHGIKLTASDFSKNRKLEIQTSSDDSRVNELLASNRSVNLTNVTTDSNWEDSNIEEAMFVASIIEAAVNKGISVEDIAVITPFRRQVKAIRQCCTEKLDTMPLIDTVERLQGQDVDLIIMSMSVSNKAYFMANKDFLMNPNRLNVMLSRAKKKIIVVASEVFEAFKPYSLQC